MILSNMLIIGGITALFGGTSALFQNDIKKIIAFSTCSQLGYMIYSCGASNYAISFFHLSNHAFFKALLFLSAGSIIHALFDQQDMRKYGGLIHFLPISYGLILIGSIILMGFPFFSGYYSKDILIISSFSLFSIEGHFSFFLGNLSAFFTSLYSFRLIYLSFFHQFLGTSKSIYSNIHESSLIYPILPLLIFSLSIGYYSKDFFLNPIFWNNAITFNYHILDAEFLIPFFFKLLPLILSILAFIFGIFIIFNLRRLTQVLFMGGLMTIYRFFNQKWYFDMLYNHYILLPILSFGYSITFNLFDKGFIDFFGPSGLSFKINNLAYTIAPKSTGSLYSLFHSSFFILIGLFFYLFLHLFSFDWIFFSFFSLFYYIAKW